MRAVPALVGCTILVFVVIFWRLGEPSFWDPDEAHYAETTRELIAGGDGLTPTYNDGPFFDKPILFHWLQSLPMRIVGPTEGAARFVPALACLALVGITWWVGTQLAGAAVGALAALLLTCSPGIFGLARYAILDSTMTALLFGGVSCLAVSAFRLRPRLQYLGYVLIGLATFVKGPIAIILSGLAFVVVILVSRDARQQLATLKWFQGLVIVLALSAPWFVVMMRRHDGVFVQEYFLKENVTLFVRGPYGNQPGWWFYLGIVAIGLLPWTWIVLGRLYDQVRSRIVRGNAPDVFDVCLWSWVATIIGFFSLSHFKLDHYVFPTAPALCLLSARGWNDLRTGRRDGSMQGTRVGAALVGPTMMVAGLIVGVAAIRLLALPASFLIVPGMIILLGTGATIRYAWPRIVPEFPTLAMVAMGVVYAGTLIWVIPHLEAKKVVPDVARWVVQHAAATDRIATFRLNRWNPAYRFYVNRHVSMLESDEEARRFFSDPSPYYCVMGSDMHDALRRAGVPLKVVYQREGLWATSGRLLWREGGEPTRFVVTTRETAVLEP